MVTKRRSAADTLAQRGALLTLLAQHAEAAGFHVPMIREEDMNAEALFQTRLAAAKRYRSCQPLARQPDKDAGDQELKYRTGSKAATMDRKL